MRVDIIADGTIGIMLQRLIRSASRFVLSAMLITFLSPALAWQALATHDELEHGSEVPAAHSHDNGSHNDHDDEAHGFIGHVLGHLPGCLSTPFALPPSEAASSLCAYVAIDWPRVFREPPLRPPRFS